MFSAGFTLRLRGAAGSLKQRALSLVLFLDSLSRARALAPFFSYLSLSLSFSLPLPFFLPPPPSLPPVKKIKKSTSFLAAAATWGKLSKLRSPPPSPGPRNAVPCNSHDDDDDDTGEGEEDGQLDSSRQLPPRDDGWVTLIHGVWYDLRPWVRSHPGGPVAMRTAAQRDATLMLHAHHPFTDPRRLGAILEPLRVSDEDQSRLDAKFSSVAKQPPPLDGHAFDLRAVEASLGILSRRGKGVGVGVGKGGGVGVGVGKGGVVGAGDDKDGGSRLRPSSSSPSSSPSSPLSLSSPAPTSPAPAPSPAPPVDPFEAELKAEVRAHFEALAEARGVSLLAATKAPPAQWLLFALHGVALLALGLAPLVRSGSVAGLLLTPPLTWVFVLRLWHDGGHHAASRDWRVNAALAHAMPWISFADEWAAQHTAGHHMWTNVPGRDPDLRPLPAVLRLDPAQPFRALHGIHLLTSWPLLAVGMPFNVVVRSPLSAWMGSFEGAVPVGRLRGLALCRRIATRWAFAAAVLSWPWLRWGGGGSAGGGAGGEAEAAAAAAARRVACATVPWLGLSWIFIYVTQVSHITSATTMAPGCGVVGAGGDDSGGASGGARRESNWYRHQARTTSNFAPRSRLQFWVSQGLNLQIEHHLFPTVCHWHLRGIQPIVERLCLKHGVPYVVAPGLFSARGRLLSHLWTLSFPLKKGE